MSNPFKNVLVVGVTGGGSHVSWGTGAYIVDALLNSDKDWNIHILVRSESLQDEKKKERIDSFRERGVTVIEGDVLKPESLVPALKDIQLVISCLSGSSMFEHDGEIKLIKACKEAGVSRFVLSGWTFDCWETPGIPLYQTKIKSLNLVKEIGLEYTFFDTIWYEALLDKTSLIGFRIDEKKVILVDGGKTKVSGMSLKDVGRIAVEALTLPESKNAHIQLSSEEHTISELVDIYEEVSGIKLTRENITLDELKKRAETSLLDAFHLLYVDEVWRVHFPKPFNKTNEHLCKIKTESVGEFLKRFLNK